MSNGIEFVLYLGPVGSGPSDQCRRLHSQLNDAARQSIKIMDYQEISRALGAKKPAWLRGFPTLVSYESPPRVLEGTKVIETLTEWVQRQQQQQQQQQRPSQPRGGQQPAASNAAVVGTVSQGSDEFSKASVVTDDLYVSRMESKHSGGNMASRGRVTSADIESYNRSRATGGRQ